MSAASPARRSYGLREYLGRKSLTMLALGFSSGLPFLLVANTFGYWLRDEGIALTAIGFLSWVGFAYSLKFLWSPLLDRLHAPAFARLGRRRSWIALMQIMVGTGLVGMAIIGTRHGLATLGFFALFVAIASSTQDIAIDAWRIESANDKDELGLLTSAYTFGYRAALLTSEAVILPVAQRLGWNESYILYGCVMGVLLLATFMAEEPARADAVMEAREKAASFWTMRGSFDAVAGPFVQFFRAHGDKALLILLAISLFQLGYFVSGPMYNPMYVDLGLSKDLVGATRGSFGLAGILLGVAVGGYLPLRFGLTPALLIGGIVLAIGTMLYGVVPFVHDPVSFAAIMFADQFAIAVAGIVLVSYMSSLTSLGYTATQYALLSSAYALTGKIFKGFSGLIVDGLAAHVGRLEAYALFFVACGLMGLPSLALFAWLAPKTAKKPGV